jgi:hypothetical protein
MGGGELFVNLDGIAELKRGFLKLFVLQVDFAPLHVSYFGFFGICAAADCEEGC